MIESAAIYVRVSTEDQVDGVSLDDQERKCRAYAEALGVDVVAVYREEAASGGTSLRDRPIGTELLDDAALGRFGKVLVAKLDRFTRSVRHGAADLHALADNGVGVAFLDVGDGASADTSTPTGKLLLQILMSFAEFERDRIAERMSTGRAGAAVSLLQPLSLAPQLHPALKVAASVVGPSDIT